MIKCSHFKLVIETLNDSNWYIRKMAILGPKELGDVKAIDKIKRMLDDDCRDVSEAAEIALQSLSRKKRGQ